MSACLPLSLSHHRAFGHAEKIRRDCAVVIMKGNFISAQSQSQFNWLCWSVWVYLHLMMDGWTKRGKRGDRKELEGPYKVQMGEFKGKWLWHNAQLYLKIYISYIFSGTMQNRSILAKFQSMVSFFFSFHSCFLSYQYVDKRREDVTLRKIKTQPSPAHTLSHTHTHIEPLRCKQD